MDVFVCVEFNSIVLFSVFSVSKDIPVTDDIECAFQFVHSVSSLGVCVCQNGYFDTVRMKFINSLT